MPPPLPPQPTLNQPEIEWSPLPTLHEGSGGCYEVAPLMAPKSCHFVGLDTPTLRGTVQGTPYTP